MRVPIGIHGDGRVRYVGVAVAVLVHVAHERQVPSVMLGKRSFEVFDFGECLVADAEALGDFVGFGGLRLGVLAEHVEIYGDDGVLIGHGFVLLPCICEHG